ncbi:zinc transporter ZIP10 [Clonorchis sinensis]|uniref:Zinc transporter ZIP10 n=1 Tax=Clonorchis sinensis TaxID=79923 RepID=H2KUE0_CLOSI|nr:zinc transporter ZIP10 [Clonorchis sinensis]
MSWYRIAKHDLSLISFGLLTFVCVLPATLGEIVPEEPTVWCKTFRGPATKPISQAFNFIGLLEHMNEDLGTKVTKSQLAEWYNHTEVPRYRQNEQTFLQFCEKTYLKVLELASTTADQQYSIFDIRPKVWAASIIAIVVISAVGLLGVAVVPLVQKMFFNQVIQYLVAVAVGTLTGDAMLHLIPHAISAGEGHSHDAGHADADNGEQMAVYKGLVALGGVYFFFMAEKILGFVSEYRAEKKLEKESQERAMQDPRRSLDVRRLSAFRPSISPATLQVPGQLRRLSQLDPSVCRRASRAMSIANEDVLTTGLSSKAMRNIDLLYRYAEEDALEDEKLAEMDEHISRTGKKAQEDEEDTQLNLKRDIGKTAGSGPLLVVPKVIVMSDAEDGHEDEPASPEKKHDGHKQKKDKAGKDHGHSHDEEKDGHEHEDDKKKHGHGHSHEVPGSVASVAWMVILGDGLHNFTDGMAIGAAFAQSISGGLSTAVAVFCHELPHELGDFAVLLKTGMRIKEALYFNVVSSVLSLVGMLIGIAVGNVASASYWIFAVTAGTFIYIALVDMLPELSSAELRPGQTRVGQVFLQSFGLFTGVGIMLCIALFEDKIQVMID